MKIGIIGAIKEEIKILTKTIKIYKKIEKHNIYIGKFNNHRIFLIKSGIGKVSASIATTLLVSVYQIDLIINTGSAGSLNALLKIGDIIIPEQACYYDVDLTNFGYSLGQVPKNPKKFLINTRIQNFFKNYSHKYKLKFTTGMILSGDVFIRNNLHIQQLKKKFPFAIAVDMESTAIAQVCFQFSIFLIVIKSISDTCDDNSTINFKKNISLASFQSSKFVEIILENINNI